MTDDGDERWARVQRSIRDRYRVHRDEPGFLGLDAGEPPIRIAISRLGPRVELLAAVGTVRDISGAALLAGCRDLPTGGVVVERGVYLLRDMLPLTGLGDAALVLTLGQLVSSVREARALGRVSEPVGLIFATYAA